MMRHGTSYRVIATAAAVAMVVLGGACSGSEDGGSDSPPSVSPSSVSPSSGSQASGSQASGATASGSQASGAETSGTEASGSQASGGTESDAPARPSGASSSGASSSPTSGASTEPPKTTAAPLNPGATTTAPLVLDVGCAQLSADVASEILGREVSASTIERGAAKPCAYKVDGKTFEVTIVGASTVRALANSVGSPPFDNYIYIPEVNDFMAFSELNGQSVTISGEEAALVSDRGVGLTREQMTELCDALFA